MTRSREIQKFLSIFVSVIKSVFVDPEEIHSYDKYCYLFVVSCSFVCHVRMHPAYHTPPSQPTAVAPSA